MFKKVKGFKNGDTELINVDKRFEFFHNYWTTLSPKNNLLFFHEERFESHRSLIKKIEDQLNHNFQHSYNNFKYLFIENILFNQNNIFLKKQSIRNRYQNVVNIINPTGSCSGNQKRNNYRNNQESIKKEIKAIKSILLEKQPYDFQVAKYLFKIISSNKPLDSDDKNSMKFLINAFVIELFYYGYSLEYILKLPDILIFNHNLHDFPFKKIRSDFSTKAKYEKYINEERKSMNLSKMLEGLLNLVRRENKPGYYVFKVDNVILTHPHPISIGNCMFYNPQVKRQINLKGEKDNPKKRYKAVEDFYSPDKDEEIDRSKISKCNVIVKSNFKAAKNIESSVELIKAYQEVNSSLIVFNFLMNRFSIGNEGKGKVQFYKHFRLRENKKISGYGLGLFWNKTKNFNVVPANKKEHYFNSQLDFINKINLDTEFGRKIFNVVSKHFELESQKENFNFKDLWIAWEAIAKKDKLIELAQQCYRIDLKRNFIAKVKIFLSMKVTENDFYPNSHYYTIPEKTIEDIGLNVPFYQSIPEIKFRNNYEKLINLVPNYFMHDFINRIDLFLTNQSAFLSELDDWSKNVINGFYLERNMEVHSDLRNELSTIRLKDNIVMFSKQMSRMLIENIDKRNSESFELALGKITNYQNKL